MTPERWVVLLGTTLVGASLGAALLGAMLVRSEQAMSRNTRIFLWVVGAAIAVILVLVLLGSVTTFS